jgi:RNase H-fold protein (predicted Holliday junction resolvase)
METFTARASVSWRQIDLSRARRKQVRDKLAAQLILQGFLDARSG